MGKKACFIAATGQNVGKTTTCLGLIAALKRRFSKVGFIKPVGQEHILTQEGTRVDKDVQLFKEFFDLSAPYEWMSPVLFPKGFTRDYLDKKISHKNLTEKILQSYAKISSENEINVIEGTGHTGVGSIASLNNADVAKLLNLKMIIVAPGGLGSSFDTLMLNKILLEKMGVPLAGIILNRVVEEKKTMILNYYQKAISSWKIPILGVIPYSKFLSSPVMQDFENLFQSPLITGEKYRYRHFKKTRLVATSLEIYQQMIIPSQLIITPASREDIIFATLTRFWEMKLHEPETDFDGGIILTGKTPPSKSITNQMKKADIPLMYTSLGSYEVMQKITSLTAKIRIEDREKIHAAIDLVEKNIDFPKFCESLGF